MVATLPQGKFVVCPHWMQRLSVVITDLDFLQLHHTSGGFIPIHGAKLLSRTVTVSIDRPHAYGEFSGYLFGGEVPIDESENLLLAFGEPR
jgi:hypothetical protein